MLEHAETKWAMLKTMDAWITCVKPKDIRITLLPLITATIEEEKNYRRLICLLNELGSCITRFNIRKVVATLPEQLLTHIERGCHPVKRAACGLLATLLEHCYLTVRR
jgi:hypothetical protein